MTHAEGAVLGHQWCKRGGWLWLDPDDEPELVEVLKFGARMYQCVERQRKGRQMDTGRVAMALGGHGW